MISVCMATYNGASFIKEQIDSILPQLSADDELIISDDGSTDGTLEIINSYGDGRIKVLNHSPNKIFSNHEKATANFENALRQAKGEYIFLSDQDDIWTENKVRVCMNVLKESAFIVHSKKRINEKGELLPVHKGDKVVLPKNWILHLLNMKWYGCCMAFNIKLLKIALPFPYKLIGHDYWLSALALKFFDIKVIETPLLLYRNHEFTVSQGKRSSLLYKISYRIKLILAVYKRGLKSRSIRYDL